VNGNKMLNIAPIPADELNVAELIGKYRLSCATAEFIVSVYDDYPDPTFNPWKNYEEAKEFLRGEPVLDIDNERLISDVVKRGICLSQEEYEQAMRCIADRLKI